MYKLDCMSDTHQCPISCFFLASFLQKYNNLIYDVFYAKENYKAYNDEMKMCLLFTNMFFTYLIIFVVRKS